MFLKVQGLNEHPLKAPSLRIEWRKKLFHAKRWEVRKIEQQSRMSIGFNQEYQRLSHDKFLNQIIVKIIPAERLRLGDSIGKQKMIETYWND